MSKHRVPSMSPAVRLAAREVNANPGISTSEVAATLGTTRRYCSKILQSAKLDGLVGCTRTNNGNGASWWPASMMAARLAADATAAAEKERKRKRHCYYDRTARAQQDIGAEVSDTPTQRWVDASAPMPFVVSAPASVFHLGLVA